MTAKTFMDAMLAPANDRAVMPPAPGHVPDPGGAAQAYRAAIAGDAPQTVGGTQAAAASWFAGLALDGAVTKDQEAASLAQSHADREERRGQELQP